MWSTKYLFRLLCSSSAVRCKFGSLSALPAYRLEKTNEEEQDTSSKRGPMDEELLNVARYRDDMDNRHCPRCWILRSHHWIPLPCLVIHNIAPTSASRDRPTSGPRSPTNPFCQSFLICSFTSQPRQEECAPLTFLILTAISSKRSKRTVLHILYFSLYEIRVV